MATDTGTAIDLSDNRFWALPYDQRMAAFAKLRAQPAAPLFAEPRFPLIKPGAGYYALTRHADVVEASRHPELFSSEPTSNSIPDMPRYLASYFGSMINMDDPRHARLRRIVSRAFTPKLVSGLKADIETASARIVDDLLAHRAGDFVAEAAARLPMQVICTMMGIPERQQAMVLAHTNRILAGSDPEYTGVPEDAGVLRTNLVGPLALYRLVRAGRRLHHLAAALGRERRRNATGDLTSKLVTADVDGEALTDQEFGSFFILLVVAGNETTRTALSHGLKLLTDHPDQMELLQSDFEKHILGAVDEILRYATPVTQFRRTLTQDHDLNGTPLKKGDKVLLFYNAANRDPDVFADPDRFDITRSPNPHLSFGGPGPHFCLGAHLARTEMAALLRELFERAPSIRSVGEPDRLTSSFINGIKRLRYEIK
ncbi:cytochrome P450 [Catenulispora acidiphila DSM 44928]|uniref:Cytochrome P450 n=1 Tax=Catenulispora acidiphila (strain DSM 44928 / JCM 14897 / NBRC 102108 / NRRL B-24433 / ID139908) TaxID=479433 RepID=C7Q0X0_CATAD|nr:cytochrome P450 [Catenulispora acidiphila]ACU69748.1 cytochrome P450 [Catenulispora acidiphila DSM 44928]